MFGSWLIIRSKSVYGFISPIKSKFTTGTKFLNYIMRLAGNQIARIGKCSISYRGLYVYRSSAIKPAKMNPNISVAIVVPYDKTLMRSEAIFAVIYNGVLSIYLGILVLRTWLYSDKSFSPMLTKLKLLSLTEKTSQSYFYP